jgi:hypothetical protein
MPHYKDTENKLPAGCVKITDAEAEALRPVNALSYAEKRATEYPDFRDYLDGVVKGNQTQVQAYIDACLAVKAKYPKE